jgi:hypothetical protein
MLRAPWQSGSLPVNSRQQLPLWLAKCLQQRNHIQIELPACYGDSYREGMRSDPGHMNLRDHSEYYFEIGKELSELCAEPPAARRPPPAARHPPPATRRPPPAARCHALAPPPALPIYCCDGVSSHTPLCNAMRSHAMHGM